MIDAKFEDLNGRKYRLYMVRSIGPSQGFGCLDRNRNTFVATGFPTREKASNYLRQNEA
jgi:hypothetical protein